MVRFRLRDRPGDDRDDGGRPLVVGTVVRFLWPDRSRRCAVRVLTVQVTAGVRACQIVRAGTVGVVAAGGCSSPRRRRMPLVVSAALIAQTGPAAPSG